MHQPELVHSPLNFVISDIRFLTDSVFVITFSRNGLKFRAGQRIVVGLHGELDQREYSIYSGENDDYLQILVKEVLDGNISIKLRNCEPGQLLQVNGPFGSFGPDAYALALDNLFFIATGTGISPFHSIVRSYPLIDYTIIHGVSYGYEAYESDQFNKNRYLLCTTKDRTGDFYGRVTKYLRKYRLKAGALYYLCGNGSMIYEVYHLLMERGVSSENIFSEIYF